MKNLLIFNILVFIGIPFLFSGCDNRPIITSDEVVNTIDITKTDTILASTNPGKILTFDNILIANFVINNEYNVDLQDDRSRDGLLNTISRDQLLDLHDRFAQSKKFHFVHYKRMLTDTNYKLLNLPTEFSSPNAILPSWVSKESRFFSPVTGLGITLHSDSLTKKIIKIFNVDAAINLRLDYDFDYTLRIMKLSPTWGIKINVDVVVLDPECKEVWSDDFTITTNKVVEGWYNESFFYNYYETIPAKISDNSLRFLAAKTIKQISDEIVKYFEIHKHEITVNLRKEL